MIRRWASGRAPLLATVAVFVAMYAAACLRYDHFASVDVLVNLLRGQACLGIVAVGMTFVILSGGIDLSVGAVMGLTGIVAATLIQKSHLHPLAVAAIVAPGGLIFGALMGATIVAFEMPPFLVTLAGMFLARGVAFVVGVQSMSIDHPVVSRFSEFPLATPISFGVVLAVGLYAAHCLPFGRNVYAVGGDERSAGLMGLPVRRTKIWVYALSGLLSSVAGIIYAFDHGSGDPNTGTLLELNAIAAVVIGGTLLSGGVGQLAGTVVGVLILGTIESIVTFEGTLNSWWIKIVIGILLMAFILLQRLVHRQSERGRA